MAETFPDPIPGIVLFGTLNIFGGSPQAGKTIELTDLACRLRDGRPFFGHPTNKQQVGIVTTDHRWHHDQGYRFAVAGWPDIPHVSLRDRDIGQIRWHYFLKNDEERIRVLRMALDKLGLPKGSSLVLDLGQPFITDKINDYASVSAGIVTLADVTVEYGLTTIVTLHMGKPKEQGAYKKAQDRIAGSVAFQGFSDTMFTLDCVENEVYKELRILPRREAPEVHRIEHDPKTGLFIPYTGRSGPITDRALQLLQLLPADGLGRDDWYRKATTEGALFISLATFKRDIDDLLKRGLIARDEWGHYVRAQAKVSRGGKV